MIMIPIVVKDLVIEEIQIVIMIHVDLVVVLEASLRPITITSSNRRSSNSLIIRILRSIR